MGTITAQSILNDVGRQMNDPTFVRHDEDDLFRFLNDGQRVISSFRTDAYIKVAARELEPGPRQRLPIDAIALIRVVCNMNGDVFGRGIDRGNFEQQIRFNPDFLNLPPHAIVREYFPIDRLNYYVSPPQPETPGSVLEHYGAVPPDIATKSDPITVDDVWREALYCFVLEKAYAINTTEGSASKSDEFGTKFLTLIGATDAIDDDSQP